MRRALKILAWIVAVLIAIPVVAVAAVLVFVNIGPGQRLIEAEAPKLTGGMVVIQGLSGRIPDQLRVAHLEVRDAKGAWVSLDNVALDWSPLKLLGRQAVITNLSADSIDVPRLAESSASTTSSDSSSSGSFDLPVQVRLDRLHVGKLSLGAPVAGAAAVLGIDGSAALQSLQQGQADVTINRLDGPGSYHLAGNVDPATLHAVLTASEPAHGLVSSIAGLPDLGAIGVKASLDGPRSAAALDLGITAGPLNAAAKGKLDLVGMAADLDVSAHAPAMAPRPDVTWQAVDLDAHVHGPFTKPDANATLKIAQLKAAGAAIGQIAAQVQGNAGRVGLTASIDDLHTPGPKPDLLAAAPLQIKADAVLDQPDRPVTFSLSHPLIQADGTAKTGGDMSANVKLALPDLAPFAAAGGVDLQGRTNLAIKAGMAGKRTDVDVTGTLGVTGGMAPVPGLIGDAAKLDLSASMQGQDITLHHVSVDGRTLNVAASGTDKGGALDLDWKVALSDLQVVAATVSGALQAQGHVSGPTDNLAVKADVTGEVATQGVPKGPIKLSLNVTGLPSRPAGTVTAEGSLDGAPLQLAADVARDANGAMRATIRQADWKSLHAEGAFTLPAGATLPLGKLDLKMTKLDDLRALTGQPLHGSLTATAQLDADAANLDLQASNAGLGANGVGRLALTAKVDHPLKDPVVAAKMTADGISASGITGRATVDASGPQNALAVKLAADLANVGGADAHATSAATLDLPAKAVLLSALQADWHGEALRLQAPARVTFGDVTGVDRLRLALGTATLEVAGRVMPTLDLTAALRGVTPELAKPFAPDLAADGAIQADAKLTGTTARPAGEVKLVASGLHMRTGPARSLPPANLNATANLAGTSARIDVAMTAGSATHLNVTGTAPLDAAGQMALRSTGVVDLALLDPILAADGRRARGTVNLDATIAGTASAPKIAGQVQLANGDVQDFAQGIHLSAMTADIRADGQTVRINRFTARAGTGTIGVTGSVGLAGDMPVALALTMQKAQPLASDRLTATLDADLALRGNLQQHMDASGTIRIERADIRIPDSMPSSVAVLDVRRAGQKPPPPAAPGPDIGLDVTLNAPQQIFVRGHGLDAELGGKLHVGGNVAKPVPSGGFHLRHGTFSVAGTSLDFTKGDVGFNGASISDPSLDFEATSTASNVVATLAITGYASKPKITLSSVPDLPQDEVLAYLLFRRSTAQLTPFQLAAIAQALASFSGAGGVGDPLDSIRSGLGLDRLSVGGGSTGSSPTLEAGRYVAQGVYVGAKQGTSGADTQAQVQVDITKGLKLETDVGAGKGGNSVGLTYQFEY